MSRWFDRGKIANALMNNVCDRVEGDGKSVKLYTRHSRETFRHRGGSQPDLKRNDICADCMHAYPCPTHVFYPLLPWTYLKLLFLHINNSTSAAATSCRDISWHAMNRGGLCDNVTEGRER